MGSTRPMPVVAFPLLANCSAGPLRAQALTAKARNGATPIRRTTESNPKVFGTNELNYRSPNDFRFASVSADDLEFFPILRTWQG